VPTRWDGLTGANIVWRVDVPGIGHSSPIVWNDRVFLLSCLEDEQRRVVLCFDRDTGRLNWQQTVFRGPLETIHALNSRASSTPATDGELVYVTFLEVDGHTIPAPNVSQTRPITPGRIVVAAYDFDGNQKWIVRLGEFISAHGFCANPVIYTDLVIVNGDHDGDSYIAALRKSTGEIAWKVPRDNKIRSYSTPIIRQIDDRVQMVFSGSQGIVSLDPSDGSKHWIVDGPAEQFVASMVYNGRRFFMAAGFPTHHVMCIRPDGIGNVTDTHVDWHVTNAKCYVPSPVVVDQFLLVADDRGTANCFDVATGNRLWLERLGSEFSSSLVTAKGLVYFVADNGVTKIVRPGPKLDVVAENPLGEDSYASPAISDGRIFIRTVGRLWCIRAG
jgi:hypothetical protein